MATLRLAESVSPCAGATEHYLLVGMALGRQIQNMSWEKTDAVIVIGRDHR
jgi:hypothetical protein